MNFKIRAKNEGISDYGLSFLDGIKFNKKIVKTDKKHFKSKKDYNDYRGRAISAFRLREGRELYKKHFNTLTDVRRKYGVNGNILVSLWGIETLFGSYMGEKYVPEAIASLAYDGRREKYFSKELVKALQIAEEGHVRRRYYKGSWAGAMGQCQFMPSSFLAYAVDGDNDGKRDIWSNLDDIFPSMANYLKHAKFKIRDYDIFELKYNASLRKYKDSKKSLNDWYRLGVRQINGKVLPRSGQNMILIIPPYTKDSAFLVSSNFKSIKRWNNSTFYALAVLSLADFIKYEDKFFVPSYFDKPRR